MVYLVVFWGVMAKVGRTNLGVVCVSEPVLQANLPGTSACDEAATEPHAAHKIRIAHAETSAGRKIHTVHYYKLVSHYPSTPSP